MRPWLLAGLGLAAGLLAPAVEGGETPPPHPAGLGMEAAPIVSAASRQDPDPALDDLRGDLTAILAAPGWRRATWGVLAVSLDTGDTLFARNPHTPLAPASNVKLFTTAAALHYLGPDFRFRTFVLGTGPVEDGVLRGDLVLYGTGDPGLSDRFHDSRGAVMDSLAAGLAAAGIRRVEGDVLGDGTFFGGSDRPEAWDPADLNDWFAAASPALSYNENVVTLRVQATRPGASPRIHTLPDHGGVPYRNEALTVGGSPRARLLVERADPAGPIVITGEMAARSPDVWRRMTVQDPVLFAAHAFRRALEDAGLEVTGVVGRVETGRSALTRTRITTAAPGSGPSVLAQHLSRPLADYLSVTNQESHNLFADLLLRAVGRVVEGEGSYEAGARAVERFLSREAGVDPASLRLVDGSGLSAENRASPAALISVLGFMAQGGEWDVYWGSLPEAGSRGLRRMRRTRAAGNLRAKTGTIRGVSALSGVVRTDDGERVAFAIVGNDLPSAWGAKRLEDRIGARLAELSRGEIPGAVARAESRDDPEGR